MSSQSFHKWCVAFWAQQKNIQFEFRCKAADWVMFALDDSSLRWTENYSDYIANLEKHEASDAAITCFSDAWRMSGRTVPADSFDVS